MKRENGFSVLRALKKNGYVCRRLFALALAVCTLCCAAPSVFSEASFTSYLSVYFRDATVPEGKSSGYAERFFSSMAAIAMKDLDDTDFYVQLQGVMDKGKKFRVFVMHQKDMPATDLALLYCFEDSSWLLRDTTSAGNSLYLDITWEVLQGLNLKMKQQELIRQVMPDCDNSYECDSKVVLQYFMEFSLYIEQSNEAMQKVLDEAGYEIPELPETIESWPLEVPISVQLPKELTILDACFTAEPAGSTANKLADIPESRRFEGTVSADNLVSGTLQFWESGLHLIHVILTISIDGHKQALMHDINIDTSHVEVVETGNDDTYPARVYSALQARDNLISVTDPVSSLLDSVRQTNGQLTTQAAAYAYDLATFSWSDIVKKVYPGSKDVDQIKKNSVQSAISRILGRKTMQEEKLDVSFVPMINKAIGEVNDIIDVVKDIMDEDDIIKNLQIAMELMQKAIKDADQVELAIGLKMVEDSVNAAKKYDPDLWAPHNMNLKNNFDPGLMDAVSLTVETAIDWYEFSQFNDEQIRLLGICLEDASDNIALLEEIKNTYSSDKIVVNYCDKMISDIELYLKNDLIASVKTTADCAGELTKILLENTAESAVDITGNVVLNTAMKKLFGAKGGIVGIVGTAGGILTELCLGTGTTAENLENVSILYTDIEDFVQEYSYTVTEDETKSDLCKAFGAIYVGEMKMVGTSWVGEMDKNKQKENCDVLIDSLENRIGVILENID